MDLFEYLLSKTQIISINYKDKTTRIALFFKIMNILLIFVQKQIIGCLFIIGSLFVWT